MEFTVVDQQRRSGVLGTRSVNRNKMLGVLGRFFCHLALQFKVADSDIWAVDIRRTSMG